MAAGGAGRGGRGIRYAVPIALALLANVALSCQSLATVRVAAMVAACALVAASGVRLGRPEEGPAGRFLLATVALTGTALALDGLHQALFGFAAAGEGGALSEAVRARMASGRAVSTLGLPAALGGWLAMSIPATASWLLLRRATPGRRVAGAALIAVQGAGLIATRSASSLVALAAAGACVAWLRSLGTASARRRALRTVALVACVTGLAGAALFLALRFSGPGAVDEGSGPFALRAGNWKVAVRCAATWPMLGAGLGNYGTVFPAFREWGMNESRFAHNSYLQIVAEGGVLLGLPLIGLAWSLARRLARSARGSPESSLLALACLAFMLHNLVDFTAYLPTTAFLFAGLAGMACGGRHAARPVERRKGSGSLRAAAALLLCVVTVWIGLADARRDAARDLAAEGRGPAAIDAARAAVAMNPIDPDARFLLSGLLLETGEKGDSGATLEAVRQARRACALDPRTPHRWQHLGRTLLVRGDPIAAYIALSRAMALYPLRDQYRVERDAIAARIAARDEALP